MILIIGFIDYLNNSENLKDQIYKDTQHVKIVEVLCEPRFKGFLKYFYDKYFDYLCEIMEMYNNVKDLCKQFLGEIKKLSNFDENESLKF